MVKRFLVTVGLLLAATSVRAADHSDVFVGGEMGYHTYRIPAINVCQDGTVLAFAEGRASRKDHSENDIVLRRSTDNGETWLDLQVVAEDGENAFNNPCSVVLRDNGRVLLMFQHYPRATGGESGAVPGHDGDMICRNFIMHSDDSGATWSVRRDITATTKPPSVVTSVASGPGVGIELRRGDHAGRLLFPMNPGPFQTKRLYAAYSDDHGQTWACGNGVDNGSKGMGGEVHFVELMDGRVMLNSRSREGAKQRKIAWSEDGGHSWSALEDESQLIEPQCNAGFIRYSDPLDGEPSRILYSGPHSKHFRKDGFVWLSYDEAKTWPVSRQLVDGRFAYSSLARLADDRIACLYETGVGDAAELIRIARFSLLWLEDGKGDTE